MSMKKILGLGVLVLLAATACGPKAPTPPPEGPGEPAAPPTEPAAAAPETPAPETPQEAAKKLTIGVMPKLLGIDFFNATRRGAEEAAAELGIELVYDGPITNDTTAQSQMVDVWAARKFDAIAVAPNDPAAIAPALQRARKRGIKVLTWDADADATSRDYFVNQCTSDAVAKALMDVMAEGVGEGAKYVIITGSLTAANQNIWMDEMEKYRQAQYPNMINLSPTPKASEEDAAVATQVASDVLKSYNDVQGLFAITSVALPGAAEAVRKAGAADKVFLTGLSTPNRMREYVADGTVKKFVLWNAVDLGYLTVQAAVAAAKGETQPGATTLKAGRLGEVRIAGDQVILGPPITFDASNIEQYDF